MLTLSIGPQRFNVRTLAEASRIYVRERDKAEFAGRGGASHFPTGRIGSEFHISYNGRVWRGTPTAWKSGDVALLEAQAPLPAELAIATTISASAQPETVIHALTSCGFKREGMGGNTTAWTHDDEEKGYEVLLSDGECRAPTRWTDRVICAVTLLDHDGERRGTFVREWPSVGDFFYGWFLTTKNRALNFPRGSAMRPAELTADGFAKENL